MTRQIEIDRHWLPKIQKLVTKFNRYASKRSLSSVADYLDKIVKIMINETGDIRTHAAEALSRIRVFNPQLILQKNSKFIDLVLSENGQATFAQPDYVDYSSTEYNNDSSNYNYQSQPTSTYLDVGTSSSPYSPSTSPTLTPSSTPSDSSDNQKYEEWDEDEDGDFTEDLMAVSIEKLNIKNVTKVYMKDEFIKRKCAMGDGEFGDYQGVLYECTCGTLYHETCLKIQALYTGICAICDREFLKKD